MDHTFEHMSLWRIILLPFSWIYAGVLTFRHLLFDLGILKSSEVAAKTFVLGNLELGGTGKSPHTEWLVRSLTRKDKAVLSRGHGRTTEGFISVESYSGPSVVGDEPLMLKKSLPSIKVAVCENRVIGIKELESEGYGVIVLDDAFQHRALKAEMNILLTRYERPFWESHLVPAGTLRDLRSRAKAAQYIIISKCPDDLDTAQMEMLKSKAKRYSDAEVYFSKVVYGEPIPLNEDTAPWTDNAEVLVVSGLASNLAFFEQAEKSYRVNEKMSFPDHHDYSLKDLDMMRKRLSNFGGPFKAILCTAKDAVKLGKEEWKGHTKDMPLFYLPIGIVIINEEQKLLKELNRYAS